MKILTDELKNIFNGKILAQILYTRERSIKVYFPAGSQWREYITGNLLDGGSRIEIQALLSSIPFFTKEGSSLPL